MKRRLASVVLLFLLAGLVGPFAHGAFGSETCCCPDGSFSCSARGDSCSMKSGCGPSHEASPVPPTVFSVPAVVVAPALPSEARLEPASAVSRESRRTPVPDPPPRA